ncbi:MAG TPA: hypothetical protein VNB22_07270 [Pyrinomonadaceae bacterium]|nr:hypothetical protein [Pyrinomonadaceae bacterium]
MSKFILLVLFVFCFALTNAVHAQDAQAKTSELIAALGKTKYKKKEKKNISIEIYVDIKSEAVVKSDVREYAGVYEAESDYRLELRVSDSGKVEGNGYDRTNNSNKQNFTLKDARIEGALLTATKVYENGETLKFEAVFNNRTVQTGKNPNQIENRETKYGLGFIQSDAEWTNRVFLELK